MVHPHSQNNVSIGEVHAKLHTRTRDHIQLPDYSLLESDVIQRLANSCRSFVIGLAFERALLLYVIVGSCLVVRLEVGSGRAAEAMSEFRVPVYV